MYALLMQPTEAQTTRVALLNISMSGKRLSLVCCRRPAEDGYVVKVLGECRFALSSNSVGMAKLA